MFQLPLIFGQREEAAAGLLGVGATVLCFGLFGWLLALLGILIFGLIFHLFLWLFGGAKQGLAMTLRVIAYAQAPALLAAVPFAGGCIGALWSLVLYVIGLATAPRTEVWRALLAVIAPLIVALFLVGLAAILSWLDKKLLCPERFEAQAAPVSFRALGSKRAAILLRLSPILHSIASAVRRTAPSSPRPGFPC